MSAQNFLIMTIRTGPDFGPQTCQLGYGGMTSPGAPKIELSKIKTTPKIFYS